MDTPSSSRLVLPRWLRVSVFLVLIALVQGTLAYLLTWIDPPRQPAIVPLRVNSYAHWSAPKPRINVEGNVEKRADIQKALDDLASRSVNEPVIVYLSGIALQAEAGNVCIIPGDARPDDPSGWLPLREVLVKLKACPAKQKLLVFEWTAPPALDRVGVVYHDIAGALPGELDAVPDADRLVLSACSAGQQTHFSDELGQSVFAHYFQQGLLGHADGYGDVRDNRISVRELAEFLQARVERWTAHNRGEHQSPMLLGNGSDFTITSVDGTAAREVAPVAMAYPEELIEAWKARDAFYRSGQYRLTPRLFQWQQAALQRMEQTGAVDLALCRRIQEQQQQASTPLPADQQTVVPAAAKKTFDDDWRRFQQQLAAAKPVDAERIKKRFVEETRGKLPLADLDAVVFAHVLADPRLDPGTIRLCDQLLHPTPQTAPRTAETLRIRQLADLAMRVEVQSWPRDHVEALLRATAAAEKAQRQTPGLTVYSRSEYLNEPALALHAGEVRLWSHGYANHDDAKKRLTDAAQRFEYILLANEKWREWDKLLDDTLAELPWYLEALDTLPELREPWQQAANSARALMGSKSFHVLFVKHLQQHRQALHAPFAKDAIARLERQLRAPRADAATRQTAEALLSVAAPVLDAEDRVSLWRASQALANRLNSETLALDRQDNDAQKVTPCAEVKTPSEEPARRAALRSQWQIALLKLAGVPDQQLTPLCEEVERCKKNANNPAGWCDLGASLWQLTFKQMPEQYQKEERWFRRERLAWVMPPLGWQENEKGKVTSPTIEHRRHEQEEHNHWIAAHERYLARDYLGLNLESPGIAAARAFYATKNDDKLEAHVRLKVATAIEPLTEKQPYAHLTLEVTRHVPPGAFGPMELRFHRADDVWLEIAPDSATLPALAESKEPRELKHQVPVKVMRLPKAERTGLPPPLGFMIEARFEGRSYHHIVTVPIVPNTQELQILVSADPDEPANTLNEIRVRPGKVKQPHYVYVRNLTNRAQKIHVEIKTGETLLCKSSKLLTLEPDGVRKVLFDESAATRELHGALSVRVLDADRTKLLQERTLPVEVLSPRDYVQVASASYEPGREGNNRWTVQVEASRSVVGPAIAAQLVLPVQRIPGLMSIGGGTLHVELPTRLKSPRILFAENLRMIHSVDEEGPVYLHIDGVPRAFVYRTTFSRTGQVTQPTRDERPAVRLIAPPYAMAGINCLVDVEVDNAPRGTKLEIALGRVLDDGAFKTEVVREFTDAKKHRIDMEPMRDALVFDASIGDWTATFDTRAIVGSRALRARLIDAAGKEIAQARQSLVIDDSPPLARIAPTPAQVKKGSILQVLAHGLDPESGVAQVIFFYGKPDKGEIPPSAPRFKAVPANREMTQWSAALQVPADHRGPLPLSVQVINHAGLASIDTVTLDVTDNDPGKTGLGEIRGKVTEGPRPQPNLLVTLFDERGKEIARTKTLPDGSYIFMQIAPGRYRVVCVKPESQRRAILDVTVEPDRGVRVDLALML